MERPEFVGCLGVLLQCLPIARVEERIDGLFHFFGREGKETIQLAAEEAARTLDKFPTPAQFGVLVQRFRPRKDERRVECDFCGGTGIVEAERPGTDGHPFAFRCHCANASKFQKIPIWTTQRAEAYARKEPNIFENVRINPERFRKGLAWLESGRGRLPTEIRDKILKRIEAAETLQKNRTEETPF